MPRQSNQKEHGLAKKLFLGALASVIGLLGTKKGRRFLKQQKRELSKFAKEAQEDAREVLRGVETPGQILNRKKLRKFVKEEKREVQELLSGSENLKRFLGDSNRLMKDLFIPSGGNDYKPKALRPKSLLFYALVAIGVKLFVTGALFLSYPNPARLSEITTSNIFRLINEARQAEGVEPLALDPALSSSAMAKAEDMLDRQYFSHDTPEGKRPWQWIDRGQYDYVLAGENLAMGFISAESAHSALMKSPTHRKNIVNERYEDIGLAVIEGQLNGQHTQMLVQFFGAQRSSTLAAVQTTPTPAPEPTPAPTPTPTPAPEPTPAPTPTPTPAPEPTPPAPSVTFEPSDASVAGVQENGQPAPAVTPPARLPVAANINSNLNSAVAVAEVPTPESLLALGSQNETVLIVSERGHRPLVELVIDYSNIFFIGFLLFLLLSLVVNVFVKIRVQHASVIFQSLALIALVGAMALVKFHFIEQISPQLLLV